MARDNSQRSVQVDCVEYADGLLCMAHGGHNSQHSVQAFHELQLQYMVIAFYLYSKIAKYEQLQNDCVALSEKMRMV